MRARCRIGRVAGVLLVLALVGAACGDDDGDEAAPSSSAGPASTAGTEPGADTTSAAAVDEGTEPADCEPSPGVDDDEIALGVLYPQSGAQGSQFGNLAAGVRARLAYENDQGGVDGRILVAVEKDDGTDNGRNVTAARELVESDEVFGIIEASPNAPASSEYLNEQGVPVAGWAINLGPTWTEYDNFFATTAPQTPRGGGGVTNQADFLLAQGGTRLAAVGNSGSPESAHFAETTAAAFEGRGGEVAYLTTDVPFAATDFTADAVRIEEAGADALMSSMAFPQFINLYLAVTQAGATPTVTLGPVGYDERLLALADQLDGVYLFVDFYPFEMPQPIHDTYLEAMATHAPEEENVRSQLAVVGWLAASTMIRGLEAAAESGCLSRQAFIDELPLVTDYDADGFLPEPIDFRAEFLQCAFYLRIVAGGDGNRFVPVDGWSPSCDNEAYPG